MSAQYNYSKNLRKLFLSAGLICAIQFTSSSLFAQGMPDLPDFGNEQSSGNNSPTPMPSGPVGAEDDIFGLDEEFDFEKTPQQLQEEVRSQAFEAALQGLLPLRPEEVRILLERFDRTQESVVTPIYPPPKPLTSVETITMDPGSVPLSIKTGLGHVTTVNFIDITGRPWPIQNITWAGEFEIIETAVSGESEVSEDEDGNKKGGSNILRITPRNEFARGNISIRMIGLETPIIMMLTTDRDQVHYRLDAVVPQNGPFAAVPIIDQGITLTAGRADISGLLQGMAPSSAKKLSVAGVDGRTSAYNYNGQTYLRTPLTLLSPSWKNSVTSADGMRVYEIQNTPVVLLSDNGKMVRAQISDREELLNE